MKALLVLSLLCLVGCAELGRPISQKQIAEIKRGDSTKEDVLRILGPARYVTTSDTAAGKQTILTYLYYHTGQMGAIFAGAVDSRHQSATIVIGPDGIVESITASTEGTWDSSTNAPAKKAYTGKGAY